MHSLASGCFSLPIIMWKPRRLSALQDFTGVVKSGWNQLWRLRNERKSSLSNASSMSLTNQRVVSNRTDVRCEWDQRPSHFYSLMTRPLDSLIHKSAVGGLFKYNSTWTLTDLHAGHVDDDDDDKRQWLVSRWRWRGRPAGRHRPGNGQKVCPVCHVAVTKVKENQSIFLLLPRGENEKNFHSRSLIVAFFKALACSLCDLVFPFFLCEVFRDCLVFQ